MKKFYEGLGRGRICRPTHWMMPEKKVRSVNPHPYYWAAFSLTGPRKLNFESKSSFQTDFS